MRSDEVCETSAGKRGFDSRRLHHKFNRLHRDSRRGAHQVPNRMKIFASTSLLPDMARGYREFGQMREAKGDEAGAAAALTAADAIEDIVDLRKALEEVLNELELERDPPAYRQEGWEETFAARMAEWRKLVRPTSPSTHVDPV